VDIAQAGHEQAVGRIDGHADMHALVDHAHVLFSSSYQAFRPGSAWAPAHSERSRRTVMSSLGRQAWMSASSMIVVGTTRACDSLMTRAMVRRVPRIGSQSPLGSALPGLARLGRVPEGRSGCRLPARG
jgi:hypothetical protein